MCPAAQVLLIPSVILLFLFCFFKGIYASHLSFTPPVKVFKSLFCTCSCHIERVTSSATHWPLLGEISYCLKEAKEKVEVAVGGDEIISNGSCTLKMSATLGRRGSRFGAENEKSRVSPPPLVNLRFFSSPPKKTFFWQPLNYLRSSLPRLFKYVGS